MIKEKAAYLRGLADGMNIKAEDCANSRLLLAIIDCIDDIADAVDENTEAIDSIDDDLNDIFDAMDVYDEVLFDEDDEDEDECCECDDCDQDCDDCECDCCDGNPNVVCSNCGEEIPLDELLNCPKCHKPVFGDDDEIEIKD